MISLQLVPGPRETPSCGIRAIRLELVPDHPSKAMGKNITGRVKFKFLIDKDGMVKNVEITEADPAGFFEESTINAVRQWRFQPAKVKGTPVSCWCQSSIKYELDFD